MYRIDLNGRVDLGVNGRHIAQLYETPYTASMYASGLIVHYDAHIISSYPGSGTIWYDISGNGYNATNNGATFVSSVNSYFEFDGVNDYMTSSYVTPEQTTSTEFSWNIWFQKLGNGTGVDAVVIGSRGTDLNFLRYTLGVYSMYPDEIYTDGIYTWELDKWYNVCITKTNTNYAHDIIDGLPGYQEIMIYYINGMYWNYATVTRPNTFGPYQFAIGGENNTFSTYSNIRIGAIGVYDRALRHREVTLNYELMRRRFGL